MKAVVTGGAGFIGSNIAAALRERGDEVVVLDDLSSGYAANLDRVPSVKLIEGSILDDKLTSEVVQGAEVVFHHAASVGNKKSIDDPRARCHDERARHRERPRGVSSWGGQEDRVRVLGRRLRRAEGAPDRRVTPAGT